MRGIYRQFSMLMLLSFGLMACASTQQGEIRVLQERVDELEGQITHYEERIDDLSNQIFVLTDRVDSTRVEMSRPIIPPDLKVVRLMPDDEPLTKPTKRASQRQEEVVEEPLNIRMRGSQMPELKEKTTADRSKNVPSAPKQKVASERVFRRALELFRDGKTDAAYQGFASFLSSYPNHEYADNALYWMGDCRYEEKKFADALSEFLKVVRFYPGSNKMPDVLFKVGLSYQRLGEEDKARSAFADLVTGYPGSAFADLAKARLKGFKRVNMSQNGVE